VAPGYKYNLSDLAAAIGVEQLKKADAFREVRQRIADLYGSAFRPIAALQTPTVRSGVTTSWHLYPLRVLAAAGVTRDDFIAKLKQDKIGTSVHFIPLHLHPYYSATYGYVPESFPVALEAYRQLVSLPIYPAMTEDDAADVVAAVERALA
jgi:dTDP-4-amino-4,6-dideoxygalactose transaminase